MWSNIYRALTFEFYFAFHNSLGLFNCLLEIFSHVLRVKWEEFLPFLDSRYRDSGMRLIAYEINCNSFLRLHQPFSEPSITQFTFFLLCASFSFSFLPALYVQQDWVSIRAALLHHQYLIQLYSRSDCQVTYHSIRLCDWRVIIWL